jgi:hypothetical protein
MSKVVLRSCIDASRPFQVPPKVAANLQPVAEDSKAKASASSSNAPSSGGFGSVFDDLCVRFMRSEESRLSLDKLFDAVPQEKITMFVSLMLVGGDTLEHVEPR